MSPSPFLYRRRSQLLKIYLNNSIKPSSYTQLGDCCFVCCVCGGKSFKLYKLNITSRFFLSWLQHLVKMGKKSAKNLFCYTTYHHQFKLVNSGIILFQRGAHLNKIARWLTCVTPTLKRSFSITFFRLRFLSFLPHQHHVSRVEIISPMISSLWNEERNKKSYQITKQNN